MGTPLEVLLIERSECDAESTVRALRAGDFEPSVRRVDTRDAFAAALAAASFDVILSEHGTMGFSFRDALEVAAGCGVEVPFIVVADAVGEEAAVAAMRSGARDYVTKSDLGRLPRVVRRALREAEARQARREAERRQRAAEERYRVLVERITAISYVVDARLRFRYVSPQLETFTGHSVAAWMEDPAAWIRAVHPDDRERVDDALQASRTMLQPFVAEYRLLCVDGRTMWLRDEAVWVRDEAGESTLQGFAIDVTEHKQAEATIRQLAYQDAVTGLRNRTRLRDDLERSLAVAVLEGAPLALLWLSIDRFRDIDNTLGRRNGERVLREVADRLRRLAPGHLVGRVGGAEFAVVATATDTAGAIRLAENAMRALAQPVVLQSVPIELGATIGIALCPSHGEDADLLLRRADVALDAARGSPDGVAFYSKDQDPYDPRRLAVMGELRGAIERGQLRLEYQPKIDLRARRVVGVEALVRWQHPELGQVRPDEFIGVAEDCAMIRPLTRWILNEALRQCRDWQQEGYGLTVCVNLSAKNVRDPELQDQLDSLLQTWGVDPRWLGLEITESAVMGEPGRVVPVLERLGQRGIEVSIDDFGTGHSSLSYLRRLPVAEIKIDRSFVSGLSANAGDLTIVRSVVDLGHNLGLRVVAEGVEDAATWDLLREIGCDVAQGYFMARPMPATALGQWLATCPYEAPTVVCR